MSQTKLFFDEELNKVLLEGGTLNESKTSSGVEKKKGKKAKSNKK